MNVDPPREDNSQFRAGRKNSWKLVYNIQTNSLGSIAALCYTLSEGECMIPRLYCDFNLDPNRNFLIICPLLTLCSLVMSCSVFIVLASVSYTSAHLPAALSHPRSTELQPACAQSSGSASALLTSTATVKGRAPKLRATSGSEEAGSAHH